MSISIAGEPLFRFKDALPNLGPNCGALAGDDRWKRKVGNELVGRFAMARRRNVKTLWAK